MDAANGRTGFLNWAIAKPPIAAHDVRFNDFSRGFSSE
jgi:hypothetical protein